MPLRPSQAERCLFCRGLPLTREHVLPKWLQEWSGQGIGEHSVSLGHEHKIFSAPPFSATLKAVCATCNNGWMSRLEAAAKGHLKGLILGEARTIETFNQPILATWAYKTTLLQEAAMPEQKMWAPFYADLYLNRLPHVAAQVWLARYDWSATDLAARYLGKRDRRRHPESGVWLDDGPRMFKGVLTVGSAMFVTCLAHDADAPDQAVTVDIEFGAHGAKLERIWPVSYSFEWPPRGLSFSPTEFEEFAVVLPPDGE
jgi:hypothetical protein